MWKYRQDKYVIPRGLKVFPIFTAVHLDPSLHENPFEFNPMRWTDKGKMNKKTTAFGGGVRQICLKTYVSSYRGIRVEVNAKY
ncbi:unnamed protein product [Arabis nemorensis]|uniref:Cytochrome P450 n=1 Tax=Arabis nemorensis TaxID=586526 RepID=A0A565CL74_9BRAS|nr:unnamed protein product [Arabis nemorensis]